MSAAKTTPEALSNLLEALGGGVNDSSKTIDVLNAIAATIGGAGDAMLNPEAIENIAAVAGSIGGSGSGSGSPAFVDNFLQISNRLPNNSDCMIKYLNAAGVQNKRITNQNHVVIPGIRCGDGYAAFAVVNTYPNKGMINGLNNGSGAYNSGDDIAILYTANSLRNVVTISSYEGGE